MLCYHCMHEKGDAKFCPFCGNENKPDPFSHHLPAGTLVGGRYIIGRVLGEGGFGITYIALDTLLDIPVAVKEYYPYGISQRNCSVDNSVCVSEGENIDLYQKGKERLLKEAKIIARFHKEPGIVDVSGFVQENNTAYIIMEYLDGIDLRHYLRTNGAMSVDQAIDLLKPIMQSLEKIHAAGVIHRDISPDNIMMLDNGSVWLMDFGAARSYTDDNRTMSVMLKKGYAPEEQYRSNGKQGPWTDVYGICATIYRCITGKTPDESLDRIFEDNLKLPSQLGVNISPEVEKVLMYGLAVREQDRCRNMTELLQLLEEAKNTVHQGYYYGSTVYDSHNDLTMLAEDSSPVFDKAAVPTPINNDPVPINPVIRQTPAADNRTDHAPEVNTANSGKRAKTAIAVSFFSILAVLVVIFFIIQPILSKANYKLDDSADVLSVEEETKLLDTIKYVKKSCNGNLAFVTVKDLNGASFTHNGTAQGYAEMYYENTYGKDVDGIIVLLVISGKKGEREVYIATSGSCAEQLTNNEIDQVLDDAINNHHPDSNGYYDFLNVIALDIKDAIK